MLLSLIGIVLVLAVAGFFAWDRNQTCAATVEGSLRRHHATDITIDRDWLDFDSDTISYDVEYTDPAGRRHANRCVVSYRSTTGSESVYWLRPLIGG